MVQNIGIKIEDNKNAKVVSIEGLLDASMANAVSERLHDILEGECKKLVFDLSSLEYISSAGLRVLLYSAKKMQSKNGQTSLCDIPKSVQRVLEISGLNTIFSIHKNIDTAISSMK
ncbi:MAG: STAS domain-containing protein [Bdellovibrionales bacterium]|nr:STAS domain-containing protein [Bdellovibrionales bacterium]